MNGVDYSSGRPGGAALAKAGIQFACRYLEFSHALSSAKFLTKPEVADLHGNGIAIVANFESTAERSLGGRIDGIADAYDALVSLEALNAPPDMPVYFSVDFDFGAVNAANQDQVVAYLQGAGTVLGLNRVGVYGGLAMLNRAKATRTATWFWQSAGWGGSPRKVSPFAHIDQYQTGSMGAKPINGAAVDYDRSLVPNFGQWEAPGGAGPAVGESVTPFDLIPGPSGSFKYTGAGHSYLNLADGSLHPVGDGTTIGFVVPAKLHSPIAPGPGDRVTGYLWTGTSSPAFSLGVDGVFTQASTDCTAAVASAVAPLEAKIASAIKTLE